MSKDKELKIRDSLKSVYDLYNTIDDFIFTTYNYETDFFDQHIVSYLMGFDRKISTIGELKNADEWVRNNHVTVYYDKNAISLGDSCLTVPVFPQNNKTGVFHPKVIILFGQLKEGNKKSVHMFVSSCNLTVSGYGRNKEAFACVEINSIQLAESLSGFIDSLDNRNDRRHYKSGLQDYLKSIKTKSDDIEFIWTNAGTGTILLDFFQNNSSGDLTVVSPYFDESGPDILLDSIKNKRKVTIVPAIDGETYNIHQKDYIELKNLKNIHFSELSNNDNTRFIHAKIIKFGNQVFIGSYNFTSAAVKGSNAEAALVFNGINNFELNLTEISENKFLPDEKPVSNRDEIISDNSIPFVLVDVYWKESKICVKAEDLGKGSYSLRLDGASNDLIEVMKDYQEIQINTALTNHLLKHKTFTIYKQGTICFKGIVNEFDSGEYRPEISCESLSDALREWFTYSEDENSSKQDLRLINSEDEETEKVLGISQSSTNDIFDNYYFVANSYENLLNLVQRSRNDSLEKAPTQRKTARWYEWESKRQKANKDLLGYLYTMPGSIEKIINLLEKKHGDQEQKDIVYEWLIVNYIDYVVTRVFPKQLIHYDGNKFYKEKMSDIVNRLLLFEKEIQNIFQLNGVDKKYLEWISTEFMKRNDNV